MNYQKIFDLDPRFVVQETCIDFTQLYREISLGDEAEHTLSSLITAVMTQIANSPEVCDNPAFWEGLKGFVSLIDNYVDKEDSSNNSWPHCLLDYDYDSTLFKRLLCLSKNINIRKNVDVLFFGKESNSHLETRYWTPLQRAQYYLHQYQSSTLAIAKQFLDTNQRQCDALLDCGAMNIPCSEDEYHPKNPQIIFTQISCDEERCPARFAQKHF